MDTAYKKALIWENEREVQLIGPVPAPVYKLNDIYRKILYMKSENYAILIQIRTQIEEVLKAEGWNSQIGVQFDFT